MGLGLGEEVVVEVRREPVAHFGIRIGVDGERVVVLPGGRLEHLTDGADLVRVAFAVAGLVDREPHHVVGVDQRDREEPRLPVTPHRAGPATSHGPVAARRSVPPRVLLDPVGRVGGDDRVEVDARSRPTHEVAVVAVPIGEAVGLHVRVGRVREVPLADVGGAVAGFLQQGTEGRRRSRELDVLGHDHVVADSVSLEVAPGEQAGPARRAGARVGEVVGELQTLGAQPVAPGERDALWEPRPLALLVGDEEQNVEARVRRCGHGEPR